ncbi:MAG: galactokinase [Ruminococcaceae bacterium]|nr:galactokinase [Oscillospiraceae bacterium]
MANKEQLIQKINQADERLIELYGKENVSVQKTRYIEAVEKFCEIYGERDDLMIFSAPGRTEIGGNHTDHNLGKVLAGSVNLDVIAVASKNADGRIRVQSKGHREAVVAINDLEIHEEEAEQSVSLVRGMAARFQQLGYQIGGFDTYSTSNVLRGSGLSSSAAFEVLIGTILNGLFNDEKVSAVEIAKMSQYAENEYFKKPCGLMDQMASSVGGIITIDFKEKESPVIEKVNFDFQKSGYALCIVDTGGNHSDLTNEYASIPGEMKAVAGYFGKSVLREVTKEEILTNIVALRKQFGDRAVLRSLHYLDDNARVEKEVEALNNDDFESFKQEIIASGNSSFRFLQNVYATVNPKEQGLSLAIYIAEKMLEGKGAYRVHGGGFGGTTQNFVPVEMVDAFKSAVERVFGEGKCHILFIRNHGGIRVL